MKHHPSKRAFKKLLDKLVSLREEETDVDVQAFLMQTIRRVTKKAAEPLPLIEFDESLRMTEKEALGRMLKTFHRAVRGGDFYQSRYKECVVQDKLCILARATDVYEFCEKNPAVHPTVRQVAIRRFNHRSFAKAVRSLGLASGEYERTIDEKRVAHLTAFDVEAMEEFYGRHVPAID